VISAGQRRAERLHQGRGSGKAVRLKGDDDATIETSSGSQDGGDLGRVVAVVVHHEDAIGLAADLKAAFRAAKLFEAGGDTIEREIQFETDRDGGEGILQVVPAGDIEPQRT
jgi:hypothetical protein